ncbi:MAG: carbohydrate binding domain-containing protein [Desulfobacterales bacterium]|nr:carbohydrate binding domain-containing protein [Desulfobacterales bacterium]
MSLLLAAAVMFAVHWAQLDRAVGRQDYGGKNPAAFAGFAEAQHDFGIAARFENRPAAAQASFARAVSVNPLYIDAWLKLAEEKQAAGDAAAAKKILAFVEEVAGAPVKWQWQMLLMARDLGAEEMFVRELNAAVQVPRLSGQALALADMHFDGLTDRVLCALSPENLPDYLRWLMGRGRADDGLAVWAKMADALDIEEKLYEDFVSFLVGQKRIRAAVQVRAGYTGLADAMTNPGFEAPISQHIFGWRARSGDGWDVRRERFSAREGNYALRVDFAGTENLNFYHVSQCVPVVPGKTYALSFWWKSRRLTTDQRPVVEVYGLDGQTDRWRTDMAAADADWVRQELAFTPSAGCHAVAVRLRRQPSHRFDNKINGSLWVDGFEIKGASDGKERRS